MKDMILGEENVLWLIRAIVDTNERIVLLECSDVELRVRENDLNDAVIEIEQRISLQGNPLLHVGCNDLFIIGHVECGRRDVFKNCEIMYEFVVKGAWTFFRNLVIHQTISNTVSTVCLVAHGRLIVHERGHDDSST